MLPKELKERPQWVAANANKIPVDAKTGNPASVTDPATWCDYETARAFGAPYIGFVLTADDPYTLIDLDAPTSDDQVQRHRAILQAFSNTYIETSASGNGVHIICRASVPQGKRRDKVEIYSAERYMICTGNAFNDQPITDCQQMVDQLYGEMNKRTASVQLTETGDALSDEQVFELASSASNADKFNALCAGNWQQDYESQSEADFALMNILCFYTRSNEQCRRLFRYSALGKRGKAQRDAYLDYMIRKIRAEVPDVDLSKLPKPQPAAPAPPPAPFEPPATTSAPEPGESSTSALVVKPQTLPHVYEVPFPPGLVGELAQYIYDSSIRPVRCISLAGALGLMAGVAGRAYNISSTGLNLYLLIIAGTGIGKDGAREGVERIVHAARQAVPAIDQFLGPDDYASGQALVKHLSTHPCMVSIMDEFGHRLMTISRPEANNAEIMLRKVLLGVYSKSGHRRQLGRMVYSDTGKNTDPVSAPCLSMLVESPPSSFYENIDEGAVESGLIPRFLLMEYNGKRPPKNPNAFAPPSADLVKRFSEVALVGLSSLNNSSVTHVTTDDTAHRMLEDFDAYVDSQLNDSEDEINRQVWNRAHLKALRVAALVAVGCSVHQPTVTAEIAQWAIDLVVHDVTTMLQRFKHGVGKGDPVLLSELKRIVSKYVEFCAEGKPFDKRVNRAMAADYVIPYSFILQRTHSLAAFRRDKRGATQALNLAINSLMNTGTLYEVSKATALEKYGTTARLYRVTASD